MRVHVLIGATVAGMVFSGAAQADEADIRAAIAALEDAIGSDTLLIGTEPQITDSGDGYEVLFDDIGLALPDDEGWADLSPLTMHARPIEEGVFDISATLPDSIILYLEDNLEQAILDIGEQRFDGRMHTALRTFTQVDAFLGDVNLRPGQAAIDDGIDPNEGIRIAAIEVMTDLEEDAEGLWSGPSSFELRGVDMEMDDEPLLTFSRATMTSDLRRANLAAIAGLSGDLGDFAVAPGVTGVPDDDMLETLAGSVGGASWAVHIEDLLFRDPEAHDEVSLASLALSMDFDDLDSDIAGIDLSFAQSGLAISGLDLPEGMVPDTVEFDLSVADLPGLPVWSEASESLSASPMMAVAILGDAGTTLSLRGLSDAELGGFDLNGNFNALNDAVWGTAGELTLDIRGLAELNAMLSEIDPEAAAASTMVQAMAEEQDDGGHRFHLLVGEDGSILLNNTPIEQMLGMLGMQ